MILAVNEETGVVEALGSFEVLLADSGVLREATSRRVGDGRH